MASRLEAADAAQLELVLAHFPELSAEQRAIVTHLHDLIPDVAAEVGAAPVELSTAWAHRRSAAVRS